MNDNDDLMFNLVHDLFEYREGSLIRKKGVRGKNTKSGAIAGTPISGGYINICINQKKYRAHRLIWLMFNGNMPDGDIDHVNGIRSDNRIENLRCVSRRENCKNQQLRSDNKSGTVGVCFNSQRNKWESYIKAGDKKINLGLYEDIESAKKARLDAEIDLGFHVNHGRAPTNSSDIVLKNLGRS